MVLNSNIISYQNLANFDKIILDLSWWKHKYHNFGNYLASILKLKTPRNNLIYTET